MINANKLVSPLPLECNVHVIKIRSDISSANKVIILGCNHFLLDSLGELISMFREGTY
jgi:hypothetical protein